jgi:hypothetical protein
MGDVQDRVSLRRGDRHEQVAFAEFFIEQAEVFAAEEEGERPSDIVHLGREVLGTNRNACEAFLALRVNPGRSNDEVGVSQPRGQIGDGARGREDVDSVHRALPRLGPQRAGIYQHQVSEIEVLHRARDGADVALVLRLD